MLPTDPDVLDARDRSLWHLQQFTNGIFALSIAIMVLQFQFPSPLRIESDEVLVEFAIAQIPALSVFAGTFLLLAFYWLARVEQFKYCRRTDAVHLWLHLLSLLFVVLVPYTNGLATLFETAPVVQWIFSGNLFLVGLFSWLGWLYASQGSQLVDADLSPQVRRIVALESAIEPVICLVTIAMTFVAPILWSVTFLLIVPCYLLLSWWKQKVLAPTPATNATSEEVSA